MLIKRSSRRSHPAVIEPLESRQLMSATLYAFAATDGGAPDLLKVDTATGVVTDLGAYTSNSIYSEGPLALAGTPSGGLFVLDEVTNLSTLAQTDELDTLDPTTATVLQDIGNTGMDNFNLAATPAGALFAINSDDSAGTALVSINPSTGASTLVGHTNLSAISGLSSDGSTGLYAYTLSNTTFLGELARIDPATATPKPIGPTGLGSDGVRGLALGSDGVLYGYDTSTNDIVSFNTTTGAATVVSTVSTTTGLADLTSFIQPSTGGGGGGTTTPTGTLEPSIAKTNLPEQLVSGTTKKGKVTVSVDATAAVSGSTTIDLYATTTGAIDSASTKVGTLTVPNLTLKADKKTTKSISVPTLSLPAGTYTLLAQTTDSSGGVNDSTTGPTVTVANPVITLSATVSAVKPSSPKLGKPASFVVTITNTGNVDSLGDLTIAAGLSSDGVTLAESVTSVTKKNAKVKAGGSPLKLTVHFKLPTDLDVLSYYPFVTITQGSSTLTAVGPVFSPTFAAR